LSVFVFDNVSSQVFSLRIAQLGNQNTKVTNTYSSIEILKDRSSKRIESYYYGRRLADSIVFPMEILNENLNSYTMNQVQVIQEWLFGRAEPKFLSILEPGMSNASYQCWLNNPSTISIDGQVVGWSFDVECTAPYALTDIVETRYELLNDASTIEFHNLSNVEDYLYPEMSIQLLDNSTFILIQNQSDEDRLFQISGMRQGESVFVDNNRQIMIAESGDNVFQHFNLNWFRFSPGFNRLYVDGRCILTFRNRFQMAFSGY